MNRSMLARGWFWLGLLASLALWAVVVIVAMQTRGGA